MRMKIDAQVFHFYVKLVLQSRGKVGKCWYKYFLSMLLQIQRHLEETLAIAEGVEVGGGGLQHPHRERRRRVRGYVYHNSKLERNLFLIKFLIVF